MQWPCLQSRQNEASLPSLSIGCFPVTEKMAKKKILGPFCWNRWFQEEESGGAKHWTENVTAQHLLGDLKRAAALKIA